MTDTRYKLKGRLESGELAELYRAVNDEHEEVVVKLFHQKTTDPRYAQVIAETARVLNPLHHDGILHYLEVGLVKGRLAVVREYTEGYLLGQVLQRLNTKEVLLSPEMGLYIIILLAETVQRAHDAGVVHGAITPGNVVLSKFGEPALCDFGALAALQSVPALKKNFGPRGRSSYRAPEISQGDEASVRSDVYSLGALAYELLTLREASTSRGIGASSVSTRRDAIPAPSRIDRRLNSRLDPIILRALDPSPPRRFRSCADFAMALRNFLSVNGGVPTVKDLQKFVTELFPKELQHESLGPVPFSELFALSEVKGADVPAIDERSIMVAMRPSFSGGEVEDDDESSPQGPTWDDETDAGRPFDKEPNFDDGTDPGQAGPLERGWVAPPAAGGYATANKSKGPGGAVSSKASARNPRVKVIEDFSVVERDPRLEERERPAPKPQRAEPKRKPLVLPPPPDTMEMMIPTMQDSPRVESSELRAAHAPRNTEERQLWVDGLRRKKSLAIACAVAIAGIVFFAFAITRLSSKQTIPPVPSAEELAMRPIASSDPEPATSASVEPTPVRESVSWYVPPRARGRQTGYVSITADKSSIVFIDGRRVKKQTPVRRLPIAVGMREIKVQAIGSKEAYRELRTITGGEEITVHGEFPGRR